MPHSFRICGIAFLVIEKNKNIMSKNSKVADYKKFFVGGAISILLGIVFATYMRESMGTYSPIFFILGGLFILIGISKRKVKKEEEQKS